MLDTVIEGGALGALLWSLRFHNRDGGFYWHYEKRGFESYHWPGFDSGKGIDERAVVRLKTGEHNHGAIRLYERRGYVIVDRLPDHYLDGSAAIVMDKQMG